MTSVAGGVRIDVRVVPRAKRSIVEGVRDGRLLVRVTAPPVDRAANDALLDLLTETLDVPRRNLRIVLGETSRNKTIEIVGVDAATISAKLQT